MNTSITETVSATGVPAETKGNGLELTVEGVMAEMLDTIKVATWAQLMRTNAELRAVMATVVLPVFTTPVLLVDEDGKAILDADGNEQLVDPIDAATMVSKVYTNGVNAAKSIETLKAMGATVTGQENWVNTHLGKVNRKTGEEISPCLVPSEIVEEFKAADAIIGRFHKRSRGSNGGIYTLKTMREKLVFLKRELGL